MRLFSPEHIAAIAVTAAAALALAMLARRAPPRAATTLARALALTILAGFVAEQVIYAARGDWSARVNLPLQLSDAVTFVAIAALWRPQRGVLTELAWFWGLTATLQALLTPDLGYAFPDLLYFTYFVTHGGAIVAACMLVLGLRLVPRRGAAWRVFGFTAAFAAVAAIGCVATGGNYMFLRRKPSNGSILDPLGAMAVVPRRRGRARPRDAARARGDHARAGAARGARVRRLRRIAAGLLLAVVLLLAVLGIEALIAISTVPDDGYRAPSQAPRSFGEGAARPLRFVVLGDSTGAGRGAPYERGIAVTTARRLAAKRRPVTLTNLAVSGARFDDVRRDQLPAAARLRPELVLVAAGANDVTALTRLGAVRDDVRAIADRLRTARCDVAIVLTASPDVGSAPRLAQPLRTVAGWRTRQLNDAVEDVARDRGLVVAAIAERTGRRFRADRSLFAADGFHPSARGYATWTPVIEAAFDRALAGISTQAACRSAAVPPERR